MRRHYTFGLLVCVTLVLLMSPLGHAGVEFLSQIPVRTITVDGYPSDWEGMTPFLTDAQGDSACEPGTDIWTYYLARDANFLYWRVDVVGGTYSFGTQTQPKGPILLFYDNNGVVNGLPNGGIQASLLGQGEACRISINYNNPSWQWVSLYNSAEYGLIRQIAEGKIPLSLFNDFQINYTSAYYYPGYPIGDTPCDQVKFQYVPPPPCPSEMPAPMIKVASMRTRNLAPGKLGTLIAARLTGPSPDNLSSFIVKSPSGVSTFELKPLSSSPQQGLVYTAVITIPVETGDYTFEATDCQGRKDQVVKNFAPQPGLQVVSAMTPADKEYVGYGSDFRLSFQGVTGSDVYYQVMLRDYSNSIVDLYVSPPSKETSVDIPAALLQPNTAYKWMVRTLDNAIDPRVMAETAPYSFFTGSKDAPLSIEGIILSHQQTTDFQARNVTIAPWDIKSIKVYTTGVSGYMECALDTQPIIFLQQPARYVRNVGKPSFPFPIENGNYTFEVEKNTSGVSTPGAKAWDNLYFEYNPLPLISENTRTPTDCAYLTDTTPSFDWDSVQSNGTIYYNVVLRDYSNRAYWHASSRDYPSEYQVPDKDSLPTGCSFKWIIGEFDKGPPEMATNTPTTQIRTLTINPSLRGRVKDTDTGAPLYGAVVEAKLGNERHLAKANADGYYEFADLPAGDYKIEVTMEGFHKGDAFLSVEANKTFDQHFSLEPKKEKKVKKEKDK